MSPRGKVISLLLLALFWVLLLGGIAFVGLHSPRDPNLGRPERTKVSVGTPGAPILAHLEGHSSDGLTYG
jgi:hypothetical protein